ncbi:MAG: ABC transporter ATP-binding protein [Cyanobacteria bacterium HKST-UBA02]|nr:ABC transporter ATP-binding protein [Cyanobacteria bacterium HKST-UBA02]
MSPEKFSLEDVSTGYRPDEPVLSGINLDIEKGSITAIAGPNGSGKSTLLKTLARQIKPFQGRVSLGGADIWSLDPAQFARRCAYVPQTFNSNTNLTVRELVALGRNPHQNWWSWSASEEDRASTKEALERAGLAGLEHRYLATLSGGERQRAQIAVALSQESDFILLDEPISHLDFKYQRSIVKLIERLREDGKGIAVILHDLNVIDSMADQVALISKSDNGPGRLVAVGTSREILTSSRIEEVFEVTIATVADENTGKRLFHIL